MNKKKLLIGLSVALLGVSLASCSEKTTRNTKTPYGSFSDTIFNADNVVATALNGKLSMTLDQYYSQLRVNGYNIVTNEIDRILYADEIKALDELFRNYLANPASFTVTDKKIFEIKEVLVNDKDEKTGEKLIFPKDQADLTKLAAELLEQINTVIATKVYGTADAEAIAKKSEADLNKSLESFIVSQKKVSNEVNKNHLTTYYKNGDSEYILPKGSKSIQFTKEALLSDSFKDAVDAVLLEQAKLLSSQKALGEIVNKKYIEKEVEEDGKTVTKKVKNDFQIFKKDDKGEITAIKNAYEQTYMKYGTYNAVVIQFNTLLEAQTALAQLSHPITSATAEADYIKLYKDYYDFRFSASETVDINHDLFQFTINEDKDDFSKLPSGVATLVKDTLEIKEGATEPTNFLTEPRNIGNKYVLAFKKAASYDISGNDKETEYDKLDESKKEKYDNLIKRDLILSNAKSYQATDYQNDLKEKNDNEETKLQIFDPYFEYKYEYANPTYYDHIEANEFNNANIFTFNNVSYTVEEFFEDASKQYASKILNDHFQLEYANLYYNDFVDDKLISKDAKDDNLKSLNEAIKNFNSNKNSTYPTDLGLETFLLGSYGYRTKDEVIKYFYDSKAALNTYKGIKVFDEWAIENASDKTRNDFNLADKTFNQLYTTGNKNYDKIFSINIDHILINIDDNGDGQPDDPKDFLAKLDEAGKQKFQDAVVELAQAIYSETQYEMYAGNTLFEVLKYIKTQYEENAPLKTMPGTWADYKDYNFLLTVEQLASSGDITQDSVSNFVPEFKKYVEDIYATASAEGSNVKDEYEDGAFYYVDTTNPTKGGLITAKDQISANTLCQTSFGYHMIILNSFEGPGSTKYGESDDFSGFQKDLTLTLHKYSDEDKKDGKKDIQVKITPYNEDHTNQASATQFAVYYVQQATAVDSSLDSDIKKIMGQLYDQVISTYTSANFQTYILLDLLNIQVTDKYSNKISVEAANAEMKNLQNQITNYDVDSIYNSWFAADMDWTRPDAKKFD